MKILVICSTSEDGLIRAPAATAAHYEVPLLPAIIVQLQSTAFSFQYHHHLSMEHPHPMPVIKVVTCVVFSEAQQQLIC